MINLLGLKFVNPFKVQEAKYKYQALKMANGQSFFDFQAEYTHLADEANIAFSERL